MVSFSGPPFHEYPRLVDGARSPIMSGTTVTNIFDIKNRIFEYEQNNFRTLEFYRQTGRRVMEVFSDAQILDPEKGVRSVPVWYANYERAIAKLFQERTLALPVLTISISELEEDETRRRPSTSIEMWTVKDVKRRRYTRIAAIAPKAVNLSFELNIWAKYTEDMNQMTEYIMAKFRPFVRIETEFNEFAPAFLVSISDNSVVEAPDRQDRLLRKKVTLMVETYMPTRQYMIQSNGDIEEFNAEYSISSTGGFDATEVATGSLNSSSTV